MQRTYLALVAALAGVGASAPLPPQPPLPPPPLPVKVEAEAQPAREGPRVVALEVIPFSTARESAERVPVGRPAL